LLPGFDPPPAKPRFPVVVCPGMDTADDAVCAMYCPDGRGVAAALDRDGSDGTDGSDDAVADSPAAAGVEPTRDRIFDRSAFSPASSATNCEILADSGTLRAVDMKAK